MDHGKGLVEAGQNQDHGQPAGNERTSVRLPEDVLRAFRAAVGRDNVLSDPVDMRLYAYDSAIDRALPRAVVFPTSAEQISSVVKICHRNNIPYVARGAGTNLCGCAIPLRGAVVIAPTKMKRVLSIDPRARTAVVEPGLPNLFLKKALEPYGLFYAPDPASQKACTIGGNIATNAGGPHCLKYGVTSHHVLGLEVVLPDGTMAQVNVDQPGYDLTGFFVGSEGTLGVFTRATLNVIPIPEQIETMLVSFPSLESAIQTVTDIVRSGVIPATLEAMDKVTIHAVEEFVHAGYPLDAEAVLLIEVDGGAEIKGQVESIRKICEKNGTGLFRLARDDREREKLWEGRRGSYPALARLAPNVLVEDGAVPRTRLPEASKRIHAIARENGLKIAMIFHAGDGNLHPQILFDERDAEQTRKVKSAGYAMLKVCVDLGGTISGEHGIGMDKREAMRWLFSRETLIQFRRIKSAFDPENLCNPDKLIPVQEEGPRPVSAAPVSRSRADSNVISPDSERGLCDVLGSLSQRGRKGCVTGQGSRWRKNSDADQRISTAGLGRIVEHDVENFTVTVQAGIRMADLQKALGEKNQKVLLSSGGSLGGLIAANPSQSPRLRDQILGVRVVLADGMCVDFGGRVMKNVAGYDATKLFIGSWGTLGVITSVILKTYPVNYSLNAVSDPTPETPGSRDPGPVVRMIWAKVKTAFDPGNLFPDLSQSMS